MAQQMGDYEILSHVEWPECSIRIISMEAVEAVQTHYHELTTQVYIVLRGEIEAKVGDQTMRLRPYETVRVPANTPHSIRPTDASARVLSLAVPPMSRDDQHPVD